MTRRRGKGGETGQEHLPQGGREKLERELMWAIALGGDRGRIEQLERMLTPAANEAFEARVVPSHGAGSSRPDTDE
jgi:hypothetical protein